MRAPRGVSLRLGSLLATAIAVAAPSAQAQVVNGLYVPLFVADNNLQAHPALTASIDLVASGCGPSGSTGPCAPPGATTIILDFGLSQDAGADGKTLDNTRLALLSDAVSHARAGQLKVFGYVTACGANTLTQGFCGTLQHDPDHLIADPTVPGAPSGYIDDAWFNAAPSLDGIFIDLAGNRPEAESQAYFGKIYSRLKQKYGARTLMINDTAGGGFINDTKIFSVTDILQTYEQDGEPQTWPPAPGSGPFNPAWNPDRVFLLVGNVPSTSLATVVSDIQTSHGTAGPFHKFLVQDRSTVTNYDRPPSYWTTLAGLAYGFPTVVTVSGRGSGTVQVKNSAATVLATCGSATCSTWVGSGQPVTLTATPSAGSAFLGFSGACTSSTTSCTYTPSAGASVTATFATNVGAPPVISNVGASTLPTTATVTWTTDLSSDSTVDYGTTTAYGSSATGNVGTAHTVSIVGLTGGTVHYRVRSKTASGAPEGISADRVMPLITAVSSGTPTSTTATITWTTNASMSHAVDYGATSSYGSTQTNTAANGTSHSVTIGGLAPSTTYHFRVRSTGGLDSAASGDFTFVTAPAGQTPAVATLTDAFGSFDTTKWTMSLAVNGDWAEARKGLLSLMPAASTAAAAVFVESIATYSLLNSSATVNALEVVAASGGINCKFNFHVPGAGALNDVVGFWYEGGTLYAYYYVHGVQFSAASAPYSRDAHAWWRIRHSGTTVFWETSRDRLTWNVLGQVAQSALAFDLSNGILGFDVKAFGSGNATPGRARFTYLNLAPTPIGSLTDAFTSIDPARWYVGTGSPGASASAAAGVLSLSPAPSDTNGDVSVISMRPFALTGSSIVVKVPQTVSSGGNVNQILRVAPGPFDYDDGVGFWYEAGTLYAFQQALGSTTAVATLAYSPTSHAWWRLRESAGTVFWDTSPDAVTWTQRASMAVSGLNFSTAVVSVYFLANEFGTGSAAPGTASFSNVNAP